MRCPSCHADNPDTAGSCSQCHTALPRSAGPNGSVTSTIQIAIDEFKRGEIFAGRYEIIEQLGAGGMGRVYRARDLHLDEDVAIKLIKREWAADREALERFRNEIKLARKITHKNVCRVHDLHEEGPLLYLTMEYIRGEDLKSLIRRTKALATGTAVSYAHQIAEGLSEAHKLGIIHRDLKPGNIMIDKEGHAKVMDFGIARMREQRGATGDGVAVGTPEYMSPEQAEGRPADVRSDLYALGAILYEMVTGQPPFRGETALAVVHKQVHEAAPDPRTTNPQVPAALKQLILRCLQKSPDQRAQTAEEFLMGLAPIEGRLPGTESVGSEHRPAARRGPAARLSLKKHILPSLAGLALVAAILLFRPISHKKPQVAMPKIENSIAFISFENLTGDPLYDSLTEAAPNLFITKFEAMGFHVATWERLRDLVRQSGARQDQPFDAETGFLVCQREGIGALAVGKITKAGEVFATDIKVLDSETRRSLASATAQGEGAQSILLSQIDELSVRVARGLGWDSAQMDAVTPVADITTRSLEAYGHYLEGREAFGRFSFDEARALYLKAVEIDPEFSMAQLGVATCDFNLGKLAGAVAAMKRAWALGGKASPREKLHLQAWYERLVNNDPDSRARILKEITAIYPKDKEAHFWLGMHMYGYVKNADLAQREFQALLELDPVDKRALNMMALVSSEKKDWDNAVAYAKRQVAVAPDDANAFDTLGFAYVRMGQYDPAIDSYRRALDIEPDYNMSLGGMAHVYGLKEDYPQSLKWANEKIRRSTAPINIADGHFLRAFFNYWTGALSKVPEDLDVSRRICKEISFNSLQYWALLVEGFAHLAGGSPGLARRNFLNACELHEKAYANSVLWHRANREFWQGYMDIKENKTETARNKLDIIRGLIFDVMEPYDKKLIEYLRDVLSGELAIAEGLPEEAISILARLPFSALGGGGWTYHQGDDLASVDLYQPEVALARAYEMKGDIDQAIGTLESLARVDPKRDGPRLTPPKVYYDLGRLYEKRGQTDSALNNFRKFLVLWKDADPGLPEVLDAKARLAALKVKT